MEQTEKKEGKKFTRREISGSSFVSLCSFHVRQPHQVEPRCAQTQGTSLNAFGDKQRALSSAARLHTIGQRLFFSAGHSIMAQFCGNLPFVCCIPDVMGTKPLRLLHWGAGGGSSTFKQGSRTPQKEYYPLCVERGKKRYVWANAK